MPLLSVDSGPVPHIGYTELLPHYPDSELPTAASGKPFPAWRTVCHRNRTSNTGSAASRWNCASAAGELSIRMSRPAWSRAVSK
jgi:hypothetical protein